MNKFLLDQSLGKYQTGLILHNKKNIHWVQIGNLHKIYVLFCKRNNYEYLPSNKFQALLISTHQELFKTADKINKHRWADGTYVKNLVLGPNISPISESTPAINSITQGEKENIGDLPTTSKDTLNTWRGVIVRILIKQILFMVIIFSGYILPIIQAKCGYQEQLIQIIKSLELTKDMMNINNYEPSDFTKLSSELPDVKNT